MSETTEKVSDLAKQVKEKLGIDDAEVLKNWEEELALLKELREDLAPEDQEKRAFIRLRSKWQRELRSPAKFYEGTVIRCAEPFDLTMPLKRKAQTVWEANPKEAIKKGLTDEKGVALDPKAKYASGNDNPGYGKPLPEQRLIQNIVGVAKSDDMEQPVKFRMVLGERIAGQVDIPLNAPVRFRANTAPTQNAPGWLILNPYSRIQFEETPTPEGFEIESIIQQYFADDIVSVEDLPDWHKEHEEEVTRWCIVYGDVSDVDPRPNATTGNARVGLTDDTGEVEIAGWIPGHLIPLVDFGVGSRAYLNGRTAQQERDGVERTFINADGVFAPPKDKIALEETPESVVQKAKDVK